MTGRLTPDYDDQDDCDLGGKDMRSRIEENQGPFTDRRVWDCQACGEEQTLSQPDYEPTEYCTRCAHLLVPDLVEALTEARRWLGDGDLSDGLAREHWTPDYAAVVDKIDKAINYTKAGIK